MDDMYEQMKMEAQDPTTEDKFDSSEPYNEQEEDISGLNKLDLSNMAISGTDWTADTIVNQIRKGNILLSPYFQRRDAWSPKMKSRFIFSAILQIFEGGVRENGIVYFNYPDSVSHDLIAYKLVIYSVLSRIETFWVCTALTLYVTHSMLLFSIPSHP